MAIRHWIQKSMSPFFVIMLSINLLLGCVSKGSRADIESRAAQWFQNKELHGSGNDPKPLIVPAAK